MLKHKHLSITKLLKDILHLQLDFFKSIFVFEDDEAVGR